MWGGGAPQVLLSSDVLESFADAPDLHPQVQDLSLTHARQAAAAQRRVGGGKLLSISWGSFS